MPRHTPSHDGRAHDRNSNRSTRTSDTTTNSHRLEHTPNRTRYPDHTNDSARRHLLSRFGLMRPPQRRPMALHPLRRPRPLLVVAAPTSGRLAANAPRHNGRLPMHVRNRRGRPYATLLPLNNARSATVLPLCRHPSGRSGWTKPWRLSAVKFSGPTSFPPASTPATTTPARAGRRPNLTSSPTTNSSKTTSAAETTTRMMTPRLPLHVALPVASRSVVE